MGYINARDDAREQSYIINQIMSPIVNAMYYRANKKDDYESETRKTLQAEADRMGRTASQQELLKIMNDDSISVAERWNRTQQIRGQIDGMKSQWIDTQFQSRMEQYRQQNSMFGKLFGGNKAGVTADQPQTATDGGYSYSPAFYSGEARQEALDSMGGLKGVQQELYGKGMDLPYPTPQASLEQRVAHRQGRPAPQGQEQQPQVNYAEENRKAFKQNLFDQYRNMPDNQPQSQTQSKQQPQDKQVDYAAENEKAYKRDMLKQLSIQNKDFSKLEPYWYDMTPEEMTTAYKYIINGGSIEDIIQRLK
jgi:hypothetical protein